MQAALQPRAEPLADGLELPRHYRGLIYVGERRLWWTGKVAIGLRYEPEPARTLSASHERLQRALLPVAVERRAA
jgi:hypothetical protein